MISFEELFLKLSDFQPSSAAATDHPDVLLWNTTRFTPALAELTRELLGPVEPLADNIFCSNGAIAERLGERYQHYRANKLPALHRICGEILERLGTHHPLVILELGIGSIDPNRISNNQGFNPGASLRALRDICPEARILGADIDPDTLFHERGIETAIVDQRNPDSFLAMHASFGEPVYDLVIDDGLHAVSANLNTLLFAIPRLKPGGWVLIEDIWRHLEAWDVVSRLLDLAGLEVYPIHASSGLRVVAVRKPS